MEEISLFTDFKFSGVMKFVFSFLLIISLYSVFVFNAFSVNIDGVNDGAEWDGAPVEKIFEGESNSKIKFASVKNMIDSEESALYLCFMFIDPYLETDNIYAGISLTMENYDTFSFDASDSYYHSDTYDFSFDGAIFIDENNGASCEIRIGFKEGIPENISLDVRFIDSSGTYSNVYPLSIFNNSYSETTELFINEPVYVEVKTTRRKSNTVKVNKTSEYDLKNRTTKPDKTEFYIQTSPPYSYVRKTKASKTQKVTDEAKTKPVTKRQEAVTVFYEKEVIISHIYVTAEVSTTAETVTSSVAEKSVYEISANTSAPSTFVTKPIPLSKGTKYKIIIGIVSAVSFTAVAVASTVGAKKNNHKENNPDSQ